jgi:uncharacterized iron-regulated protein
MMKIHLMLIGSLAGSLLGVGGTAVAAETLYTLPIGDPARRDRQVELRLDGITDTGTDELITPAQLAERLATTGILFIGETHTRTEFHKVQLRAIQALHQAGRQVLIGLEMFPVTQQPALDAWNAGHYTEAGFVELADWYRHWGYNWGYYRDIFLYAREHGLPMYAVNAPRDLVTAVRTRGFDGLSEDQAQYLAHEVLPATDEVRRMYRQFFDVDDEMHVGGEALEGMLRAQVTWDAAMGWNAQAALERHGGPESIMVVLIGAGHVTYGLGSERQLAPHYGGRIASLIPVETAKRNGERLDTVQASYANFIWGVPAARDTLYPSLEVSLMGPIGKRPGQLIQVGRQSLAEQAGLRVGDVLLALDGQPISDGATLRRLEAGYRWGDVLVARIERDGREIDITVPLRRSPAP